MTYEEIPAQLVAVQTALVEKTGEQPFIDIAMIIRQSGRWSIRLCRDFNGGEYKIGTITAGSPAECIDEAFKFIAAMPNAENAAKQAWQGKLGKVIDEGHALALPDDVMMPLRQGSQAMTENLLAAPRAAQAKGDQS
jgi:hypothetical protein